MKPFICCNFAMSVDGKISTRDRLGSGFSSREDRRRMDLRRAEADLIVAGGETVRRDDPPFHLRDETLVRARQAAGKQPHPDLCVITASGRLPAGLKIFHQSRQRVLIATTAPDTVPPPSILPVTILQLAPPFSAADLTRNLAGRGYCRILVEGGGTVNAMFFEAGLVDEMFITLCPVVLGGAAAPTPVDGAGLEFDHRIRLELLEWQPVAGELFLRYRVGLRSSGDEPGVLSPETE